MLAPQGATVPVQLIVYRSAFPWSGRYGITASPLRPALLIPLCLYSVVRRRLAFTLPPLWTQGRVNRSIPARAPRDTDHLPSIRAANQAALSVVNRHHRRFEAQSSDGGAQNHCHRGCSQGRITTAEILGTAVPGRSE